MPHRLITCLIKSLHLQKRLIHNIADRQIQHTAIISEFQPESIYKYNAFPG